MVRREAKFVQNTKRSTKKFVKRPISSLIFQAFGTFKTLFTEHNSFVSKVSMKANSISNAAARASGTYKSNGTYNNALSETVSKKVDEEV